jgi:SET domain-containing protein
VKQSPIHGRGLFARSDIPAGEVVAVKGGHIITRSALPHLPPRLAAAEIQIDEDLFISPVTEDEREGSMVFSNHSCEPNVGVRGQIVFIAMRDVRADEELTHDWAMTDDDDSSTECRCGAAMCRGTITGKDWRLPELQQRYRGYFSSYLLEKMRTRGSGE